MVAICPCQIGTSLSAVCSRRVMAGVVTVVAVPWLTPAAVVGLLSLPAIFASAPNWGGGLAITVAMILGLYALAIGPAIISVMSFAIIHLRYRNITSRRRWLGVGALIGFVVSVLYMAVASIVARQDIEFFLVVGGLVALNAAVAGWLGSILFLRIVEGRDVDGHRQGRADWHR